LAKTSTYTSADWPRTIPNQQRFFRQFVVVTDGDNPEVGAEKEQDGGRRRPMRTIPFLFSAG
jgi:hypothetical protein